MLAGRCRYLIAFLTAPLFVELAVAEPGSTQADNSQLEQNLILAMSWVRGSFERLYESNVPILDYAKAGYVSLKPDKGVAYVDYRILRKPAYLFGAKIVTIEEEYPKKDVGCCVSSGIGAVVKVEMGLDRLKRFAAENACSVDEDQKSIAETLSMLHLKADDRGHYASISCRDRDVPSNAFEPLRDREDRTTNVTCVGKFVGGLGSSDFRIGDKCRLPAGSAALSRVREACAPNMQCLVEASATVKPDGPLLIEKIVSARKVAPGANP